MKLASRTRRTLRILDFDIENRPLAYWYDGATTAEITAIAYSFGEDRPVICWLLGRDDPVKMLLKFREAYDDADIVTGHYIRKHDLPILNSAMLENGLAPLGEKLTSDTKLELVSTHDLSVSQESLAAMLGIEAPKIGMSQKAWRAANRLTPDGIALTEKRVIGDVRQHQAMRAELVRRGLLGAPKMWRP